MALPDVSLTVQDFQLGLVAQDTSGIPVKLGISAGGKRNVLSSGFQNSNNMTEYKVGPIVEAAAHSLGVAGGPCYLMPVTPSALSSPLVLTLVGTGTGTVTVTPAIWRKTYLRIATGGAVATATFQISIDGVTYDSQIYTTAATVTIDRALTIVAFTAGTYVAAEVYTFNTDGTVTQSGAGPLPTTSSSQSAPTDKFQVLVQITKAGALATAEFKFSLDNGDTYSSIILTPSAGKYVVPDGGFYLLFAGTFVLGDVYSGSPTPAAYDTTNLNTAFTALLADSTQWGFVHVVGEASSAANAALVATAVDTQMTTAETGFRYVHAIVECPSTESDATIKAAFASFASKRVSVVSGDEEFVSSISGRVYRRQQAYPYAARVALIPPGEDPAFVGRGPLPAIVSLYRNEFQTQSLDEGRFTTLRTHIGIQGFYVTNGRMMAAAGSDFTFVQYRRVMDLACTTARQGLLPYLNASLRINSATGKIEELDAKQIEAKVNAQLQAALVATGNASDTRVIIDRNANLLSTLTLPVTVEVSPLGYAKFISVVIGFRNFALAQAA